MSADGYVDQRERGVRIVALPSAVGKVRSAVAEAGTLHVAAARATSSGARSFEGRGIAYRMHDHGGDWLVRHYYRGGAVARLLDDRYLRVGEPRPLRELRASTAARQRGVATPEVVAAIVYPAGMYYRADLATRFIDDAQDLDGIAFGDASPSEREAAWHAAGRLLRTAFAAGVEHADLNMRNILVTADATAHLLDLDRAVVRDGAVSDVARSRMLERLHRSRRKLEAMRGRSVPETEMRAFQAGLQPSVTA